jgi:carbonic anhydrase
MCAKDDKQSFGDISYEELLAGNKEFVKEALDADPEFFERLVNKQNPPVLWIGCSDSRVPANQITHTKPGEIFVHRNIANVIVSSDMNMLSVLDYAVNILDVKYVIICGHYGCGGVAAAMSNKEYGLIDNWLSHIKDVYRLHAEELDLIEDLGKRRDRLTELNVIEGVYNLSKTSIVQKAWQRGAELSLHGWAYSLETGIIKDLEVNCTGMGHLPDLFKFEKKL